MAWPCSNSGTKGASVEVWYGVVRLAPDTGRSGRETKARQDGWFGRGRVPSSGEHHFEEGRNGFTVQIRGAQTSGCLAVRMPCRVRKTPPARSEQRSRRARSFPVRQLKSSPVKRRSLGRPLSVLDCRREEEASFIRRFEVRREAWIATSCCTAVLTMRWYHADRTGQYPLSHDMTLTTTTDAFQN